MDTAAAKRMIISGSSDRDISYTLDPPLDGKESKTYTGVLSDVLLVASLRMNEGYGIDFEYIDPALEAAFKKNLGI